MKHEYYENSVLIRVEELPDPPQTPLDAVGALATLLAVTGAVTVQDAANVVGLTAQELVNEALAWGAVSNSAI